MVGIYVIYIQFCYLRYLYTFLQIKGIVYFVKLIYFIERLIKVVKVERYKVG